MKNDDYNQIIAYQGVDGAYSHLACKHAFPEMTPMSCHSFIEALEMVHDKKAKRAIIPLENSTAGRVEEIYRVIPELSLYVIGEHFEPVNHCLMGLKGVKLKDIKYVTSHPQALAQCFHNIRKYNLSQIESVDTAGAAKKVGLMKDPEHAAIASSIAADLYGLEILEKDFQDKPGNVTRFLVFSTEKCIPKYEEDGQYITSILFRVRNIPAALYKALGGFATNGVNLVKLESYTNRSDFQVSMFHADIEAHPDIEAMVLALQELNFYAETIRLLGTYEAHPYRLKSQLQKSK